MHSQPNIKFHQNVDTQVYKSTCFKQQNTANFIGIAVKPTASLQHDNLYVMRTLLTKQQNFMTISIFHVVGLRTADPSCCAD
jgi:hypothetical protein